MAQHKPILVIGGQTATGKSDFGVLCAERYNGEVVSADSRQVYTELNALSGKITAVEMHDIPHHMLSVASVAATYTVNNYIQDARKAIAEIQSRGKLPIIVGGTGFYIRALLYDGIMTDVDADAEYRKELQRLSIHELQAMLTEKEPEAQNRFDIFNKQKIIRALEIIKHLGHIPNNEPTLIYPHTFITLTLEKELLHEKIKTRLEKRWAAMLAEAQAMLAAGVTHTRLQELGLECKAMSDLIQNTSEALQEKEIFDTLLLRITQYSKRQKHGSKNTPILPSPSLPQIRKKSSTF